MAEKKTDQSVILKGADELHIKGVGVFFIVGKAGERKAYYADGRPVKPGKLWLCKHCQFIGWKEIDFAKHMVEKHPEQAKGKTPEAKEAAEKREAAEKAQAALKVAAKKAKAAKAAAAKKAKAAEKAKAKKAAKKKQCQYCGAPERTDAKKGEWRFSCECYKREPPPSKTTKKAAKKK